MLQRFETSQTVSCVWRGGGGVVSFTMSISYNFFMISMHFFSHVYFACIF